jgi:hypothetical protein
MVDEPEDGDSLNDRLLDALVYAPVGLVVAAVEEFPKLVELGRNRLGAQVSSARAVGQFVVVAGGRELRRRSDSVLRRSTGGDPTTSGGGLHAVSDEQGATPAQNGTAPRTTGEAPPVDRHVPDPADLAIPAYDTLSASQVVQRLDGLSRSQLVSARAYETGTRGRRTILSRIDQLLDERS